MLRTGIWNIPMKSCAYPWFTRAMVASLVSAPATRAVYQGVCHIIFCALPPCSWPGWFSKCWCLRVPPVQFSRLLVGSLVSAPATRAVYRGFRPQCSDGSIWRCRFRRSCCVEWFSRWLVPEIIPFAFPCCLSCICFGAGCAWWNRLCVEFSVVSCFRLPASFADLVFAMIDVGH